MMRSRSIPLALLAALLLACAASPPASSPIAGLGELAGRTAGAPRRCIPFLQSEAPRLGDERTLLYGNGRTIWVNRFNGRCAGLERDDTLVIEPIGSQYCRGDRVRTVDPVSGLPGAACILGDFVPHTR